jgi:hypothetical protein
MSRPEDIPGYDNDDEGHSHSALPRIGALLGLVTTTAALFAVAHGNKSDHASTASPGSATVTAESPFESGGTFTFTGPKPTATPNSAHANHADVNNADNVPATTQQFTKSQILRITHTVANNNTYVISTHHRTQHGKGGLRGEVLANINKNLRNGTLLADSGHDQPEPKGGTDSPEVSSDPVYEAPSTTTSEPTPAASPQQQDSGPAKAKHHPETDSHDQSPPPPSSPQEPNEHKPPQNGGTPANPSAGKQEHTPAPKSTPDHTHPAHTVKPKVSPTATATPPSSPASKPHPKVTPTPTPAATAVPPPSTGNGNILFDNTAKLNAGVTGFPYESVVPGHVKVVPDPLGKLGKVMEFDIADSDRPYSGASNPRADFETPGLFPPNSDRFFTGEVYLPPGFPKLVDCGMSQNGFTQVSEVYGPPHGGSPPLGLKLVCKNNDGHPHLTLSRGARYGQNLQWISDASLDDGQWHEYEVETVSSTDPSAGLVRIWFDGKPQVFANNQNTLHYDTLRPGVNWDGKTPNVLNVNFYRAAGAMLGKVTLFHGPTEVSDSFIPPLLNQDHSQSPPPKATPTPAPSPKPAPSPTPTPSPAPNPSPTPSPNPFPAPNVGNRVVGTDFEDFPLGTTGHPPSQGGLDPNTLGKVFDSIQHDYDSQIKCDIVVTDEQALSGKQSLKVTASPPSQTPNNNDPGRCQPQVNMPPITQGTEQKYSWGMLVPQYDVAQIDRGRPYFLDVGAGFRNVDTKANGPGGGIGTLFPPSASNPTPYLRSANNLAGTVGAFSNGEVDVPFEFGKWLRIMEIIRWSHGSDGFREVFADGKQVGTTYHGATLNSGNKVVFRADGIYEGVKVNEPRSLYLDDLEVDNTTEPPIN